jgi:hypothetical protein
MEVRMAERIWDSSELTPAVVRAWGYDEELLLLDQDEDLLLYDVKFIPVLLELAGDERCPKRDYAFCILCQFCRKQITRGGERGAAALKAAWSAVGQPAGGLPLEWHEYVGRMLGYTKPSGPVDKIAARRMADDLLLGIAGRRGKLEESDSANPASWRFTLRTSVIEHVGICEATGQFSYRLVFVM